ncbi:MAG: alpha-rhamnosidase, partial [Bacteroidales bacterium]
MKKISPLLFTAALFLVTLISSSFKVTTDQCSVVNLKTEYLVNPIGLDTPAPRFTWQLEDGREGALQTAYRIVIGTDAAEVAKGNGNIWNTARVKSDRILVVYDGPDLL